MSSSPNPQTAKTPSRTQFWLLVGIFFVPLTIAFALYYGLQGWRPVGQTNHGDLVHPPRPLPQFALSASDATDELTAESLRGKWTVTYIGSGACDERCHEALELMRQSRLALNDDMKRVQRLFLTTGECCDTAYLQREHEGLLVARLDDADSAQLAAEFQAAVPMPIAQAGRIYIIDPLGNLMMSYAPDAEPKGLLQDLKKLLKLSHIG